MGTAQVVSCAKATGACRMILSVAVELSLACTVSVVSPSPVVRRTLFSHDQPVVTVPLRKRRTQKLAAFEVSAQKKWKIKKVSFGSLREILC